MLSPAASQSGQSGQSRPHSPRCLICYHSADLDGRCSAAVAYWHLVQDKHVPPAGIAFFPVNYGEPVPPAVLQAAFDSTVWILDFSFPPCAMRHLWLRVNPDVIWCDHHVTAMEDAQRHQYAEMNGVRFAGAAACELTHAFCRRTPPPRGVALLGRYDVWDHADPDVLPFQFGCRAVAPHDPADPWWRELVNGTLPHGEYLVLLNKGRTIMQYLDGADVLATKSMFTGTLTVPGPVPAPAPGSGPVPAGVPVAPPAPAAGFRCLFLNRLGGSAALVKCAPGIAPDAELLLSFGWDKAFWRCELRNGPAAPTLDLSVIAKALGGGGHPHAAGFCCARLPFDLG